MPVTRLLELPDAAELAALLRANRTHLDPWQPLRPDSWFTDAGQGEVAQAALTQHGVGTTVPLVIEHEGRIVGAITLQSVIRGAFQSCSVGYWLAGDAQGRGLATQALREAVDLAFGQLRLHRVQAETVPANLRSQQVLARLGFVQYGQAEKYLHLADEWQDNLLYQLLTPTPERVVTT